VVPADPDPLDDPAWRAHLFRVRSESEIGQWARSLDHVRFCRGPVSPFFTEPDRFVVALSWRDTDDRAALLADLGLRDAPDGWQDLDDLRVRVEIRPHRLTLAISGAEQRRPQLTARDVEAAARLDSRLGPLADRIIDPPVDDRTCVTPARYPSLFTEPRDAAPPGGATS
jgi:hypothetical protein